MNWGTQYTPAGIVFAIVGGVIGAVITSRADNDGWPRTLAEALVAAFAAAALGEYYLPLTRVWVCAGCGTGNRAGGERRGAGDGAGHRPRFFGEVRRQKER